MQKDGVSQFLNLLYNMIDTIKSKILAKQKKYLAVIREENVRGTNSIAPELFDFGGTLFDPNLTRTLQKGVVTHDT